MVAFLRITRGRTSVEQKKAGKIVGGYQLQDRRNATTVRHDPDGLFLKAGRSRRREQVGVTTHDSSAAPAQAAEVAIICAGYR